MDKSADLTQGVLFPGASTGGMLGGFAANGGTRNKNTMTVYRVELGET